MGYLLTILANLSGSILSGVGLHLVLSMAGIFFLGYPTIFKIAAYTLAISEKAGLGPELSMLLALAVSLLAALFFCKLFIKVSGDSFAVLGLASILAMEALTRSWDSLTNGVLGIAGIRRPEMMTSLSSLVFAVGFFALIFFTAEYLILKTWIGRALRAYKENEIALQSIGIPTQKLGQKMLLLTSMLGAIAACFFTWRVQFLDPSAFGIPLLIEFLTFAILALKPKMRSVAFSAAFVVLIPEILRFFNFPSAILGYTRILIYALILMVLIRKLSSTFIVTRNSI